MKTQTTELQLHDVKLMDDIIRIDYSLIDDETEAHITSLDIKAKVLLDFIEDNGLNELYVNLDELHHLNAHIYLTDNLWSVVKLYLEEMHND